jgi:hypothetical protein
VTSSVIVVVKAGPDFAIDCLRSMPLRRPMNGSCLGAVGRVNGLLMV